MGTLVGESTSWSRGLRDSDAAIWSKGAVKESKAIDAAYAALHGSNGQPFPQHDVGGAGTTGSSQRTSPKPKRSPSMKVACAAEAETDLRAVELCQKPSASRTQEDIKFICAYMNGLSYFFSLWPAPLQWELSRLLTVHILARREVALSRGRPPDRLYFVVQGKLDVRLPVPSPGGGREERTLAVLTRGHTVGEAVLLSAVAQHTSVVVSSSSAMLLSLSRPDFSRAFKEVLDIRQAERLMYLRLHPLMVGLPLPDLEAASEVLGLAFFPPGTRLWPLEDSRERCLYFLAEGQARVRRAGAGAAAGGREGAQHEGGTAEGSTGPSMYDRFTISILGPGDIFGLPSSEQALALQLQQSVAAAATAAAVPGTANPSAAATLNLAAALGGGTTANSAANLFATGASTAVTAEPSLAVLSPSAAAAHGGGGPAGAHSPLGGLASSVHLGVGLGLGAHGAATTGHSVAHTAHGGPIGHGYGGNVTLGRERERDREREAGVLIESYSSCKVYTIKYCDYPRLPASVQAVLQAANAFRWSYYEGRVVGLARMDNKRRDARREQLARNRNNAALKKSGDGGSDETLGRSAAASAALQLAERDKLLLGRVPIISAGVAGRPGTASATSGGAAGGEGDVARQLATARRAAQAADAAQQARAKLQRQQQGEGSGEGEGWDFDLPAWAQPGGGRMLGTAAGVAANGQEGRTGAAALQATLKAAAAAAAAVAGTAGGRKLKTGGQAVAIVGGGGGGSGAVDGLDATSVYESAVGSGGAGAGAGAGVAFGTATNLLNPLLYRSANGKALLAVQAGQLCRVLAAERQQFDVMRRPVLHPPDEYGDAYDEDEDEDAPWAASNYSGSESDSRLGRSSRRPVGQPHTTQYLTSRAEASPPRDPTASLQPTLKLLHPTSHAFPRVQSYRRGHDSSPPTNRSGGSPTRQQGLQGQSPQPGSAGRAAQQAIATGTSSTAGGSGRVVPLALDARDVVETEQPRALVAPQSIRQRHVLLFQNAQAMAAAASNSRPWIKPVRQPRPSYSRVHRASHPGSGRSGHGSDGGASTAALSEMQLQAPTRVGGAGSAAGGVGLPVSRFGAGPGSSQFESPTSAGRRPVRPDDRLSRYGSMGRASSAGAGGPGGGGGGGAGGGAGAGGGGGKGRRSSGSGGDGSGVPTPSGIVLISSDLPSPKSGFVGRAGPGQSPASPELSFSHLGIRDIDEDGGSSSGGGGSSGGGSDSELLAEGQDVGFGEGGDGERLDDEALLARVPARLLGAGRRNGGAGGTGALPRVVPIVDGGPGGGAVGRGAPPRKVAPSPGGGPLLPLPQMLPASPHKPPSPAKPPVVPAGAAPASGAPSAGAAESAASGGSGGSLNNTMRRRVGGAAGAGDAAASASAASGGMQASGASGTGAGATPSSQAPVPPLPTGAINTGGSAPAVAAGSLGPRAASGPQRGGLGSTGGGGQRPMDAEFPQDLDERQLHHTQHTHHHHVGAHVALQPPQQAPQQPQSPHRGNPAGGASATGAAVAGAQGRGQQQGPGSGGAGGSPQQGPQVGQASALTGEAAPQLSPAAVGLPPAIALGYESLDPFAWAALASQVGPSIRTPFTQDNLLPKPQWQA
ncbi:hypothetical protein HXX76_014685 [Chlamydomonas incerta]|uniref:Cyclic nucleotide-binding domain-containing protein n=1 Tax=Chlamydomonas incerta TaxID=51695 RepID=A0A835VP95_CHLIN|nr:hypothetical protein HXX76_014685 [Chlamydomonas incerta]|eukprot:KAG2424152.1 hypothetical protein HXX76_014685 [Chlamydomonas incerta]